jgi:hypothetical protein
MTRIMQFAIRSVSVLTQLSSAVGTIMPQWIALPISYYSIIARRIIMMEYYETVTKEWVKY